MTTRLEDLIIEIGGVELLLDENMKSVYINQAHIEYDKGNYQLSVDFATKALELDPESINAYCIRGIAYETLGELDKAKEDLRKGLSLSLDDTMQSVFATMLEIYETELNKRKKTIDVLARRPLRTEYDGLKEEVEAYRGRVAQLESRLKQYENEGKPKKKSPMQEILINSALILVAISGIVAILYHESPKFKQFICEELSIERACRDLEEDRRDSSIQNSIQIAGYQLFYTQAYGGSNDG